MKWLPSVALSTVLGLTFSTTALGASQFELWWGRYNDANGAIAHAQDVKQAVFYSYRLLKLGGYCKAGSFLDFDSIVRNPTRSSCCGDFSDYALGAVVVEGGTALSWYPEIDLKTKETIWQTLAKEALGWHEGRLKEIIQKDTRGNSSHKIDTCYSLLSREYPD